jgi:peptidoglycan/xylan/chitin deacetylase (PgdA/CDA1 family)
VTASSVPILTYHSQNVAGPGPDRNDHAALAMDLEALHGHGFRFVPLGTLLEWLAGQAAAPALDKAVCITFDDGCDLDVRDIEFPGHGLQRSFLGIMRDFARRHGQGTQPGLHATSFVIADPEARSAIDAGALFAKGWMNDDWWRDAAACEWLAIGNHGWDHKHPDVCPGQADSGGFASVESLEECREQVVVSAQFIASKTGAWPEVFAYPYGESSAFIREVFFPGHADLHRCRAAVGTEPGSVTRDSDRWNLPRYVCGRDWQSPEALLAIVSGQ